jgi:hypothetical protein
MAAIQKDVRRNILVIFVFLVVIFNVSYNLSNFPTFFWDQGVYIERGITFIKNSVVYDDPTYIDHPPLGWILPSLIFKIINFPDSIVNTKSSVSTSMMEQQIMLLFLIPRLIAVTFTLLIAILIYKIAFLIYDDRNIAITSLASFSIIPAIWPFRNMLLDPIMITFVMLSLFLLLSKKRSINQTIYSNKFYGRLLVSGFLFGIALLVKLTAIFFLPAALLFVLGYWQPQLRQNIESSRSHFDNTLTVQTTGKQKIKFATLWLVPIIGCLLSWIIFLATQHILNNLVTTQLWQISRPSLAPAGIAIPLLIMASPIGAIFGIFGLARTVLHKETRTWSVLGIPYLAFLLRGGYVGWVHTIPLLPLLSLYAGKPLFQLTKSVFRRLIRNQSLSAIDAITSTCLITSFCVISIAITIWLATFDEGASDRQAIQFLIYNTPKNAVLVTDPGYGWVIKFYRPDLNVINYYLLQKMQTPPPTFYIAEKANPSKYDPTLQNLDALYYRSCLVKIFENNPSNSFFHPYSVITNKWWNVQVLHFDVKGCTNS